MNILESRVSKVERRAIHWLAKLESPDLSPQERTDFLVWLKESPVHQAAYLKAEQLWQRGHVLAKAESHHDNASSWTSPFGLVANRGLLLCSFCAIMAMVVFGGYQLWPSGNGEATFRTLVGEQKTVELVDQSILHLNTNSLASFKQTVNKRELMLTRGEAYLHVSQQEARPFDVVFGSHRVRVLGTRFSVKSMPGEDSVVTVLEGRVGVLAGHDPIEDAIDIMPDLILTENERVVIHEKSLTTEKVDAAAKLAWRREMLVYQGEHLRTVVEDINRYFEQNIILSGEDLPNKTVFATLHLHDFESMVAIMAESLDLSYEHVPDSSNIIFYEK